MQYTYTDEGKSHLHALDGKPLIGTSSAASVLAKPLTWWASGLAVSMFGWTHKGDQKKGWAKKETRLETASERQREISMLTPEAYLKLCDDAYAAHSTKLKTSASDGTDLHAIVESYIKECMDKNDGEPIVPKVVTAEWKYAKIVPFINWAGARVKKFLWSEMHCYSERLWVGGITDFGFEDVDGKVAVGDIKSSKEAYLSQFWQCAGYDIQISENGGFDRKGNKVFTLEKPIDYYMIFPFGMEVPEAQYYYDVAGGRAAFEAELFLYKKLNN